MKYKSPIFLATFALPLLFAVSLRAEFRTWTSTAGTKVEAELVDFNSTHVTLELRDGKTVKVARDSLIASDLETLTEKAKVENSNESKSVSPIDRINSLPQELLHDMLRSVRHYWYTEGSGREAIVGRYYFENENGVTIRKTTGGLVTIPWDKIARTGTKASLDVSDEKFKAGNRFRGFIGEEIPWPEANFSRYPNGNLPEGIKFNSGKLKKTAKINKDKELEVPYVKEIASNGIPFPFTFGITPPDIEPNTWVRFGMTFGDYYKKERRLNYASIGTIHLTLNDGSRLTYSLNRLNPIGEYTTGYKGKHVWIHIPDKIKTCEVTIGGGLLNLENQESDIFKIKTLKVYKAYLQK